VRRQSIGRKSDRVTRYCSGEVKSKFRVFFSDEITLPETVTVVRHNIPSAVFKVAASVCICTPGQLVRTHPDRQVAEGLVVSSFSMVMYLSE
jgi:hypothetical protein